MNPELQNRIVAETCGWKFPKSNVIIGESGETPFWWEFAMWYMPWLTSNRKPIWAYSPTDQAQSEIESFWNISPLPDYGNDLNAIHQAEEYLINKYGSGAKEFDYFYWTRLSEITKCYRIDGKQIGFATASQRREAIIKTLNKWIE